MSTSPRRELDPFVPALKIKIVRSDATFDLDAEPDGIEGGPRARLVTVTASRVVVGRGPHATLPVVGAKGLSRAHLVLEARGGLWTFVDSGSTNGTHQQVGGGDGKPIWSPVRGIPRPVDDGMVLLLANTVQLTLSLERRGGLLAGTTTDHNQDAAGVHRSFIDDSDLEVAAAALLQHRRNGHPERGAATVDELIDRLGAPKRTVQRRLEGLRGLPSISARVRKHPDNLADLLAAEYPYLLLPRDDDPPSAGDGDTVTSAGV